MIRTSAPSLENACDTPGSNSAGWQLEGVRHGTVSILAGIDLHSGHVFANIEDRHRSVEFVGLLKQLVAHYPEDAIIRVVLDNHSAHISKETMAYPSSRPGRFEYVHTPKHGSWLNLIERGLSVLLVSGFRIGCHGQGLLFHHANILYRLIRIGGLFSIALMPVTVY